MRLDVDDDGLGCRVFADNVKSTRKAMICAYTEYGLEAAFMLQLTPETIETR